MIKPILFNADMVRAILTGRKTVTRRVVKDAPNKAGLKPCKTMGFGYGLIAPNSRAYPIKPSYRPGDILYVRETFCPFDADHMVDGVEYAYRADATPESERVRQEYGYKWRPSIHMPREAARIFLRVTDVWVERLQEIALEGCLNEGITWEDIEERDAFRPEASARWLYEQIWNSTIKPADRALYGWETNPWVWVIEFERISREDDLRDMTNGSAIRNISQWRAAAQAMDKLGQKGG